jgi:hypothetical protein
MTSTLCTRVAAVALMVGGVGFIMKYLLLAIFDQDGTSTSNTLIAATTVGLLLGEFLAPFGVAALVIMWLRGRHRAVVTSGVIVSLAALYLVAALVDTSLQALLGNQDPLRLRTEGSLAVLGIVALVVGILAMRRRNSRLPTRPGHRVGVE